MPRPLLLVTFAVSLALAPSLPAIAPEPPGRAPTLPPGLTLPVVLAHTLRAGRTAPGTAILAHTTQRVPLPGNTFLPRGAGLLGTVTSSALRPDTLTLHFTAVRSHGRTMPLTVHTLAIAGFTALSTTSLPSNGSTDRGNSSSSNWTTTQVGGDQVVRSQWTGPLINTSTETVGFADFHGVYANPLTPGGLPRALGPFSAGSTGLFGYDPDCLLATETITCRTSTLTLRAGDALLLETLPPSNP